MGEFLELFSTRRETLLSALEERLGRAAWGGRLSECGHGGAESLCDALAAACEPDGPSASRRWAAALWREGHPRGLALEDVLDALAALEQTARLLVVKFHDLKKPLLAALDQAAGGVETLRRAALATATEVGAALPGDVAGAPGAEPPSGRRPGEQPPRRDPADAEPPASLETLQAALDEARVYRREGDVGTATLRARQALDLAGQVRNHANEVAARYSDDETVARWQRWRQETIDWSRRTGRVAILVSKAEHALTLIVAGRPVKSFRADMGFNWIADKSHAGDGATPEGRYRVVSRKANGASIYYKALLLDYPNAEDRAQFSRSRRSGELPASAAIGGLIEIHGEGGRGRDWTRGCVAVTNHEMDELFRYVDVGTPVTIIGSDTHGAMAELTAGTGGLGTTR